MFHLFDKILRWSRWSSDMTAQTAGPSLPRLIPTLTPSFLSLLPPPDALMFGQKATWGLEEMFCCAEFKSDF